MSAAKKCVCNRRRNAHGNRNCALEGISRSAVLFLRKLLTDYLGWVQFPLAQSNRPLNAVENVVLRERGTLRFF